MMLMKSFLMVLNLGSAAMVMAGLWFMRNGKKWPALFTMVVAVGVGVGSLVAAKTDVLGVGLAVLSFVLFVWMAHFFVNNRVW